MLGACFEIGRGLHPISKQAPTSDDGEPGAFLPIHFFTLVLNGEPFIRHHIEVFRELPFAWHWHVIEGAARLNHDTAWSRSQGGVLGPQFHDQGRSIDGTKAYLDQLARDFPQNVTIYSKPPGILWDGKIEMVRAPLEGNCGLRDVRTAHEPIGGADLQISPTDGFMGQIPANCLLWQIDSDELWTVGQICRVRELFKQRPEKTAAYFYCHYFVGEGLVTTTRNSFGNQTSYEWLRVWRYRPGLQWITHEPPRLCERSESGKWVDLASINPFTHSETEAQNLVFQHFAYATEDQLRFKSAYYGYQGALEHWRNLQRAAAFPRRLGEFFPWVKDDAIVGRSASENIKPLAQKNILGEWRFRNCDAPATEPTTILFVRPDSIGDTILGASMLAPIRDRHPHARLVVTCQDYVAEIYEACPHVDQVIPLDRQRAIDDSDYRDAIADRLRSLHADLCLNPVFSREPLTDFLALASGASTRIAQEGSAELMAAGVKEQHDSLYSRLIPRVANRTLELDRHADFLKGIGIDAGMLQPAFWLKTEDERAADELLQKHNLQSDRTIALFAGAHAESRIFAHYGRALREICLREKLEIIALGSRADSGANQSQLEALSSRAINLSGTLTLRQTAAILKRCRLAVGAETGLAHIACAVGTPNVIVLGGGHFGRFMPYSPLTSVVCLPLECYGCNWLCRYQRPHCVKDIAPDVLSEAIQRTLSEGSAKPRVFVQGNSIGPVDANRPAWKWADELLDKRLVRIIRIG